MYGGLGGIDGMGSGCWVKMFSMRRWWTEECESEGANL